MTRHMWDLMCLGDQYVPDLEFSAEGPYGVFRETVERWKEAGYKPFDRKRREA